MSEEKICDRCFKKVGNKDDYFMVVTFIKGKEVKKGFMHKSCNDEIEHQKKKMMNMVNNVGQMLPNVFEQIGVEQKRVVMV